MRLSPWGRVVAISALLVVGGALALAIGALATTRERLVSYPVTGALEGLAFDLGDGDIVIVGGGRRDAVEVRRTRALRVRPPRRDAARSVAGRRLRASLALPDLAAGPVHASTTG